MNLLNAFGITEATDKLCEVANIEAIDWNKLTSETIEEIGREDVKINGLKPSSIILNECGDTACIKCGEETGWGFTYCKECRA